MFRNAKVGDTVWDSRRGYGKVVGLNDNRTKEGRRYWFEVMNKIN